MQRMYLVILIFIFGLFYSGLACSPVENTPNDSGVQDTAPVDIEGQCKFSSDCKCDQMCKDARCTAVVCKSSADCRCQWVCVNARCYEPKAAPCQSDADCKQDPKLWKCESGSCVDGGCRSNTDCTDQAKPICNISSHICEKLRCSSNRDCSEIGKPICNTNSGECEPDQGVGLGEDCSQKPCLLDLYCHEDKQLKLCRKPCVPFSPNNSCPPPTICIETPTIAQNGLCLPPSSGAALNQECSPDNRCQSHLFCAFSGEKDICRQSCKEDVHCDSTLERCLPYGDQQKLCQPYPPPCGPGRACPGEDDGWQICRSGICEMLLCPKQRNCPVTDKCTTNGRCAPRVCPQDACDPLYFCKNNRCVRTNGGSTCGPNTSIPTEACGDGLICARVGYIYTCVQTCDNDQCPADFSCQINLDQKKICIQNCPPSGKPCLYPAHGCVTLKRSPAGNFCAPVGQPGGKDILELCNKQTSCLPDLKCFVDDYSDIGYCVQNCKTSSDCTDSRTDCLESYSRSMACYATCPSFGSCTIDKESGYCVKATSSSKYFCILDYY